MGTAEQRIELFRSLFRGRDDVYAIRWESADGRSGYMPKADRDWKSYLRAKDKDRKKVDRQTRKFRPLTQDVVRGHLVGDHTVGIYPLLQDETCWFLAVDFDKRTWQKDAAAFLVVLSRDECASGFGTFSVGKRRPCVDILQSSNSCDRRAKTGLRNSYSNHGVPPPSGSGVLRPILPQPGHDAQGRSWQPDRVCLCKSFRVRKETVFLSIQNFVRTKISGHFWQAWKECRLTQSRRLCGKLRNEEISLVSGSAL